MEMFGIAKPKEKKVKIKITNCDVSSTTKKWLGIGAVLFILVISSMGSDYSNSSSLLDDHIACKKISWQQIDKNDILDLYTEALKMQNK